jgi:hypothetical protein
VQYLDSHSDAEQFIRVRTERLRDSLATDGAPTVRAAHDQTLGVGDLIISRNNDATIEVPPGAGHRGGVDQVRNGNRWRVAGIDPTTNRVAAERTTDKARVVFGGDYLPEHVTLGYAVTVHSAQGVTVGGNDTAGVCHSIMGEGAARAMAYVAMTRAPRTKTTPTSISGLAANPITNTPDPSLVPTSPAAQGQQILRHALLPDDPGQRRPAAHHARRS